MTSATIDAPQTARAGIRITAALSFIAGVTDVTSWLLLGGFFSAHVTGNIVVIAADVVTGRTPGIGSVLAIPVFILAAAAATLVARRMEHAILRRADGDRRTVGVRRAVTAVLLGSQAVLLIAAAALSFTTRASSDPSQPIAVGIALCAVGAMAAQNAYLHLVPATAASTAVMTGNLVAGTVAGIDLLLSRGGSVAARARWAQTWPLLSGFVGGCLVGAAGAALFSDRAAIIPAVLALLLFIVMMAHTPRLDLAKRALR